MDTITYASRVSGASAHAPVRNSMNAVSHSVMDNYNSAAVIPIKQERFNEDI